MGTNTHHSHNIILFVFCFAMRCICTCDFLCESTRFTCCLFNNFTYQQSYHIDASFFLVLSIIIISGGLNSSHSNDGESSRFVCSKPRPKSTNQADCVRIGLWTDTGCQWKFIRCIFEYTLCECC